MLLDVLQDVVPHCLMQHHVEQHVPYFPLRHCLTLAVFVSFLCPDFVAPYQQHLLLNWRVHDLAARFSETLKHVFCKHHNCSMVYSIIYVDVEKNTKQENKCLPVCSSPHTKWDSNKLRCSDTWFKNGYKQINFNYGGGGGCVHLSLSCISGKSYCSLKFHAFYDNSKNT